MDRARKTIGRWCAAFFFLFSVCGCVAKPKPEVVPVEAITIPPAYEQAPPNSSAYVELSEGNTVYSVIDYFSRRGLLSHFVRDRDVFRLTTLPTEEREAAEEFRRVTYLVKISLFGAKPECTWVEVRWFLEGRPYDGVEWEPRAPGTDFQPLLQKGLMQTFAKTPCSN
jgi:hypothetical protein